MNASDSLKIAVAGTGYVGLSIATLLSQRHEVVAVDVIPKKSMRSAARREITTARKGFILNIVIL